MQYSLPALPFDFGALEPHIDAETMMLHHDKHHQTYVDKLNAALATHPEIAYDNVDDLLKNFGSVPQEIQTAVRNHGGGHSNHSLFWSLLSPAGQVPSEACKSAITAAFSSWDTFVENFNTAATTHFGSGWTWLVKDTSGTLSIKSYPNQDSPFMEGLTPIMGIDVWEHAYYLRYQNRRPEYVTAFWQVLNWETIERRLTT